jgi:hypothetical protein
MQNIPQSFISALKSNFPKYVKKVTLSARYFENGVEKYLPYSDISANLIETGPLKWKLDTEGYNILTASNVSLTFANTKNEFYKGGAFFPSGSVVYKSKMSLYGGAVNADGREETVRLFEGYLLHDPRVMPEEKTITFYLSSPLALLEKTSAGALCAEAAGEPLRRISDTVFSTANTSVGYISEIMKGPTAGAALPLAEGADYTLKNLGVYKEKTQVILTAPAGAENLWCSYKYFYEDKDIDWAVDRAAALAGIADRQIEKVIYDKSVGALFKEGGEDAFTGEHWQTEIKDNAVTLEHFSSYSKNVVWTPRQTPSGGAAWNFTDTSVGFTGANFSGTVTCSAPQALAYGTWRFTVQLIEVARSFIYYFAVNSYDYAQARGISL